MKGKLQKSHEKKEVDNNYMDFKEYIANITNSFSRNDEKVNVDRIRRFTGASKDAGAGGTIMERDGHRIELLKSMYGFDDEEAQKADNYLVRQFSRSSKISKLPERPVRDINPRENIIEYLRSPDGLGPWLEAGELNRPLVNKLAPKAYISLSNWLRSNSLPDDIDIPTKKEMIDREINSRSSGDILSEVRSAEALRKRAAARHKV